jgi:flagellar FliJ protein
VKRFHFKLEKVLSLREDREREAKNELGKAIGILTEIEGRIASLAEEKSKAFAVRFAPSHGAAEIRDWDLYITRLDKTRDVLLEEAAKAELAVEEARAAYLEASRDRKVLDKLRERREAGYHKELAAEEIMAVDDLSGRRAALFARA